MIRSTRSVINVILFFFHYRGSVSLCRSALPLPSILLACGLILGRPLNATTVFVLTVHVFILIIVHTHFFHVELLKLLQNLRIDVNVVKLFVKFKEIFSISVLLSLQNLYVLVDPVPNGLLLDLHDLRQLRVLDFLNWEEHLTG